MAAVELLLRSACASTTPRPRTSSAWGDLLGAPVVEAAGLKTEPFASHSRAAGQPVRPVRRGLHELVERARPRESLPSMFEVFWSIYDTFLRVGFRSDWRAAPCAFGFTFVYVRSKSCSQCAP